MNKRKDLICALSYYSTFLKIMLKDQNKEVSFSKKVINFDEIMINQIKKMINKLNYSFKDITTLCIVRGPGRFTAIRSVYTFASVYKVISKCKVFGVDVFECLAYNIFKNDDYNKDIAVISHAFRDEYYLAFYKIREKRLFKCGTPQWLSSEDMSKKLNKFKGMVIYDKDEFDIDLDILKNNKNIIFPNLKIMKIIPANIINAAYYFSNCRYEPIYLKPAKFEIR
ncbi:MAG: hypothetical protein N2Z20_05500 [Elusimicrobiales bacterium]|nr:hypothetical protein [Elusimicrobiales bacterium]